LQNDIIISDFPYLHTMIEPKIKGNFFERLFLYIKKKLGPTGLEKLGVTPGEHKVEQWYPYEEFCELLNRSAQLFPDLQPSALFKIGQFTMSKDERWQQLFKDQDPHDVFETNQRQDALFMIGRFAIEDMGDNNVTVRMTLWSTDEDHNDLWAEYYQGIVQGVMDATGTTGTVEMEKDTGGERLAWIYLINW